MIPLNRFTVPIKKKSNDSSNVTVVLLASIPNPRMKTMPSVSLLNIDKQHNVIDIQVEAIRAAYPKSDIILVTGHDSNQVIAKRPNGVRIIENQLYNDCGENEEIRLALNNSITECILLINGNCIFNASCLQQLRGHGSCTLVDTKGQMDSDSIGVIANGSKVENLAYGIESKWCYVSYIEGKEYDLLKKFSSLRNRSNMCMFESINYIVSNGGVIYTVEQNAGYLRKISSSKDILI